MGICFVEGGADGDAQCAQLEDAKISDGCITSDMDYFLFGGKHMYKVRSFCSYFIHFYL